MRAGRVEVLAVRDEDGSKMRLAENYDVIETLTACAAKKPFADRIDQGRPDRTTDDLGVCSLRNAVEQCAELRVPVSDEEGWPLAESRCVAELPGSPLFGRSPGDRDLQHFPGVHINDEECEERTEPDVIDLKKIARPDGVIL